jgi:hypothetical protein
LKSYINTAGTLKGDDVFSYGPLQWKTKTVKYFAEARDGSKLTSLEAKFLALDTDRAATLASHAIFETEGGVFHWQNCATKLGLAAEVAAIKKLSN